MSTDHGKENPDTHGNDDAVWLDLVARLEAPEFMADTLGSAPEARKDPEIATLKHGNESAEAVAIPEAATTQEPKGVVDFDPLGVWEIQGEPAPKDDDFHQVSPRLAHDPPPGHRNYSVEELDEDFVPEELPSLAGTEPILMLSWIGAVGGPLFLIFAVIFWRGMPILAVFAVVIAFLAGTGYLLSKLPNNRDHDDGDGAVV